MGRKNFSVRRAVFRRVSSREYFISCEKSGMSFMLLFSETGIIINVQFVMKICIELVEMFDVIQFGKCIYRILFKNEFSRQNMWLIRIDLFLIESNVRRVWFYCVM
jgi:hypothetical protein